MLDLIYHWNKIREILSDAQAFQSCIYLLFVSRYCDTERIPTDSQLKFGPRQLSTLLQAVPDYEVKRAAVNLENSIDWVFIFEHRDAEQLLKNLQFDFNKCAATSEWLNSNVIKLFELANQPLSFAITPDSVGELISVLAADRPAHNIADLYCGGFNLGYKIGFKQAVLSDAAFYGEELNAQLCDIARLRLFLSGAEHVDIRNRDSLSEPDVEQRECFDLILTDFPVGNNKALHLSPRDRRFGTYNKSSIYADWFSIQDALYRLSPEGRAFLLVTKGALVRKNEINLRRELVKADWLEAVITLPTNLYLNTTLAMELMICNKSKAENRKGKVLFADISKFSRRRSRWCRELTQEGIAYSQRLYKQFKDEKDVCNIATVAQIENNNFSLNPLAYITVSTLPEISLPMIELGQIALITRGLQLPSNRPATSSCTNLYLNIKDIENGVIEYEGADHIPCDKASWDNKFLIEEDDIIITSKGTALKIAIVLPDAPKAYIGGNLTLLRMKERRYDPYVLYEYLCSQGGRFLLERLQTGTTIRVLAISNLAKLHIPIHDNDSMFRIGKKLKENWITYQNSLTQIANEFEQNRILLCSTLNAGGMTHE